MNDMDAGSVMTGFAHRRNEDGTVDSICRKCFITVGTEASEPELEIYEQQHDCDPVLLKRYGHMEHVH